MFTWKIVTGRFKCCGDQEMKTKKIYSPCKWRLNYLAGWWYLQVEVGASRAEDLTSQLKFKVLFFSGGQRWLSLISASAPTFFLVSRVCLFVDDLLTHRFTIKAEMHVPAARGGTRWFSWLFRRFFFVFSPLVCVCYRWNDNESIGVKRQRLIWTSGRNRKQPKSAPLILGVFTCLNESFWLNLFLI